MKKEFKIKSWKKIICVMLAVIIAVSIVPIFSYADEVEDNVSPTANVKLSTYDWTKESVLLNIENAKDNQNGVGLHNQPYSFSLDSGVYNWGDSADFTVTNNGNYYVSVRDINDNIKTYQISIDNIDKTAPSIVNGSVVIERDDNSRSTVVTIPETEDNESGMNKTAYSYSIYPNVYNWTDEASKVFYDYTGKVYVYARDSVNNIALLDTVELTEYSDNSDEVQRNEQIAADEENEAPLNTTDNPDIVSFDANGWTKEAIVNINTDAEELQGKVNGDFFSVTSGDKGSSYCYSYENYFTIKINGHMDIYLDGSREEIIATAEINNVDTAAPVINNVESKTENGYTVLSVDAYDEQSGICEYSFDGGETWQKSNTVVFKENSKNYFDIKVKDFVGRTAESNYYINVPKYYVEDNKVILYSENTDLNDKIYYAEGENDDFKEYKTPIDISDNTVIYTTFGENSKKLRLNSKRYSIKKNKVLPVHYNESQEDAVIKYKNLQFKINRAYSSENNNWFFSVNSKLQYNRDDDIINAKLFDGNETVYYPSSNGIYINAYDSSKMVVTKNELGDIIKYTLVKNGLMYNYDANGRLSYISNRYEDRLSFKWSDNQLSVVDDKGRCHKLALDSQGNILSITDLSGNKINYSYSDGKLVSVTDQTNTVISSYDYDSDGVINKSSDKSIKFDDKGYLSEFEYDNGAYVKFSYRFEPDETYVNFDLPNLKSGYLIYDKFGNLTKYNYDGDECVYGYTVYNVLGTVIDNGNKTNYYCDKDVLRSTEEDGNRIYYDYDEDCNVILEAKYVGEGSPSRYKEDGEFEIQKRYEYENGLPSKAIDCINDSEITYLYDGVGNLIKTTTVQTKERARSISSFDFKYDEVGNIVNQYSDNLDSEYVYDDAGRLLLSKINGVYHRTVYDDKGRIVQEISDENYDSAKDGLPESDSYSDSTAGHTYTYDAVGDLAEEKNELGIKTDYEYSKGVMVNEKFDIYEYCYDQSENLTDVYVSNSSYAHYKYDDKNNLRSINYGNGQKEIYSYDSQDRITSQSLQTGDNDPELQYEYIYYTDYSVKVDYVNNQSTWYYDDETVITTLKYDNTRLIKGDVIYKTMVSVKDNGDESTATVDCSFLSDLRKMKLTVGKNAYKTELQGTEYSFESSYDKENNVQSESIKNTVDSIIDYDYKYDDNGRVESYSVNTKNFSKEYGYEYDNNGNITAYGSWQDGKVSPDDRTDYHYDSNGQLIRTDEHRYDNGSQVTDGTSLIEYDGRGNLTAVKSYAYSNNETLTGNHPEENFEATYSYEDNVWIDGIKYQKGSEKQYVYDENGNPISFDDLNFHWTNGRQLDSLSYTDENGEEQTIVSYKYDDNGIRTSKTVAGETTHYIYSNGNILAQYKLDENGSPIEFMEFLYDKAGSIVGFTYEDKTYFYVKNPQGDVTNIVDSNGVNLVNYYYYCYGESSSYVDESSYEYGYDRDSAGIPQEVNPITYRGYYRDDETSFYYLQSRYYIPTWGRFVNADIPIYAQEQKDDFAGINLFAYCRNNPVNFSDPTGFKYVSEAGKVVAIAITEMFVCLDLQEIAKQLGEVFDFDDLQDYFQKKVDLYKKAFDKGIIKPWTSENKKITSTAGWIATISSFFDGLLPKKTSTAISLLPYITIMIDDTSGRYISPIGTAIMLLFDGITNGIVDIGSTIISTVAKPIVGVLSSLLLNNLLEILGTRDKAEYIAYNWYYIFFDFL